MSLYSDLSPQILRNCGNKDDTDFPYIALSAFNSAQKLLAWATDWPELQVVKSGVSFVSGTYQYTVATLGLTRYRKPHSFMLLPTGERGQPLQYIPPMKFRKEYSPLYPTTSVGRPRFYTVWGTTFFFYTIPDTYPYDVWYHQYPYVIANLSDATSIQFENADDVLVFLSTAFTFLAYEEVDMAKVWVQRATDWLRAYGSEQTVIAELEAAFSQDKPSVIQSQYWSDPFAKQMP